MIKSWEECYSILDIELFKKINLMSKGSEILSSTLPYLRSLTTPGF